MEQSKIKFLESLQKKYPSKVVEEATNLIVHDGLNISDFNIVEKTALSYEITFNALTIKNLYMVVSRHYNNSTKYESIFVHEMKKGLTIIIQAY